MVSDCLILVLELKTIGFVYRNQYPSMVELGDTRFFSTATRKLEFMPCSDGQSIVRHGILQIEYARCMIFSLRYQIRLGMRCISKSAGQDCLIFFVYLFS